MTITSRPRAAFRLGAAVAALSVAALAVPAGSSASNRHVDGVRAAIKHGTLDVKGGDRPNAIALRLKAGDASRIELDVGDDGSADRSFARSDLRAISVKTGDGGDSVDIDDANGAFTDAIPTTIAGGDGNDALNGGLGAETFRGGGGADAVLGRKGSDTAYLGGGNDSFRWDPGDGSDVIEGQDGSDTMVFNGVPGDETVTLTAIGRRLLFFRTPGNVSMDTDGVETVDFNALGGADTITVNDLTGTDVTQTNLDLAGSLGGSAADGAADSVVVNGTNGADTIEIAGSASGADVTGLATAVSVKHAESLDRLSVNTLAGADTVSTRRVAGGPEVLVDGAAV